MGALSRNKTVAVNSRYESLIRRCEKSAINYFTLHLESWFKEVEDSLMAAADDASDNRAQLQYIETIRTVMAEENQIVLDFSQAIHRGFEEFSRGDPIFYPFQVEQMDDQLSLMSAEEEEEFLVVKKMADRFYGQWPEEFYGLEQRFSMVRGGHKIGASDLPAGPMHVTFSFQSTLKKLQLSEAAYSVLYGLFAQVVLQEIISLYIEFNGFMIEADIFPHLKYVAQKQPEHSDKKKSREKSLGVDGSAKTAISHETAGQIKDKVKRSKGKEDETKIFDTISKILNKNRLQDPRFRNHPDINPYAPQCTMVEADAVVETLQDVQPEIAEASHLPSSSGSGVGRIATVEVNAQHLLESRDQLSNEKKQFFEKLDPNTVHINDIDVIEMVGMLFEQILDEDDLPNVVKALLSYLHTPYLKVGIIDPTFLTDSEHKARKLLNLMVHAGRFWVDETDLRCGIYYSLKRSVDRILDEFRKDVSMFDDIHIELWGKVEQLDKKSTSMEKRSRDAAGGHERLIQSREQARKVIDFEVGVRLLHPDIKVFLYEVWLERLSFMLLRNPAAADTKEWQGTCKVIKTLILPFDRQDKSDTPKKFKGVYLKLKKYIDKAVFALGDYHQPKTQKMFERYEAFINGDLNALTESVAASEKMVSSEGLISKISKAGANVNAEEEAMIEKIIALKFGTWMELVDNKGRKRAIKLSWLNPLSKHCMFVDQSGVQALMISANELARRICNGQGKILEQVEDMPFVGRALRKISQSLKILTRRGHQAMA